MSKTFDLLAVHFLLGGVIVCMLRSRERSSRFAWAGGILLGLGMCELMSVQGFETLQLELERDGGRVRCRAPRRSCSWRSFSSTSPRRSR